MTCQTAQGLSQEAAARLLGIDPGMLRRGITIFVVERSEEIKRRIPASVEAHPVGIVVSGRPRPRT